jgi:predicted RNase H-like nuclease (RuvC/YqgF family)
MGAQRFSPETDLERSRKETIGEGENSHEKDAHAAAVNAYKNLRKSIEKVNRRARETGATRERLAEEFLG